MKADRDLVLALETARLAVEAGGEAALRLFRTALDIGVKDDRSPVTKADRDAEAAILKVIREVFPDHDILAEESGEHGHGGRERWIVDPIDGTRGFSRGAPFWGPLVAYEHDGEILAGAMALPALGETYWAARGHGAFRNGERLRVSEVASLGEATLSLGEFRGLLSSPCGEAILALAREAASVRIWGDLAGLAMLLAGRADVWIEAGVKVWDLAPAVVLVEEAGGRFTDFAGRRTPATGDAVASNGRLHDLVLTALGG